MTHDLYFKDCLMMFLAGEEAYAIHVIASFSFCFLIMLALTNFISNNEQWNATRASKTLPVYRKCVSIAPGATGRTCRACRRAQRAAMALRRPRLGQRVRTNVTLVSV